MEHLAMSYTWEGTLVRVKNKSTSTTLALAQYLKTIQQCFLNIPYFPVLYSTVLNMKAGLLSLLDLENIQTTRQNFLIIQWPQHGRRVSTVITLIGCFLRVPTFIVIEFTTEHEFEEIYVLSVPIMVGPPSDQWQPRAVPTPTMDGVYHIYDSVIYELTCTSSACTWTTIPDRFTTAFQRTRGFQAIYIPENLVSCS